MADLTGGNNEKIEVVVDARETGIDGTIAGVKKLTAQLEQLEKLKGKLSKGQFLSKDELSTLSKLTDLRGKDAKAAVDQAAVSTKGAIKYKQAVDDSLKSIKQQSAAEQQRAKVVAEGTKRIASMNEAIKKGSKASQDHAKSTIDQANKAKQAVAATNAQTKGYHELNDALAKTTKTGVKFGAEFGSSSSRQGRQEIKAWKEDIKQLGAAVTTNQKTTKSFFSDLKNNQANLSSAFKSTAMAGVATQKTLDSIKTGARSTFVGAIGSTDQFRVKLGALKNDLGAVFAEWTNKAKDLQWTGRQLMVGITLPVAAFANTAVKAFASFDQQFTQLKKVMIGEGNVDFGALKSQILSLAGAFGQTDTVVAGLYRDLAAIGKSGDTLKGWSEGVLKLATVGDIDIGVATDAYRVMDATFNKGKGTVEELNKEFAQLNAIADDTAITLGELTEAMPEASGVTSQLGFSASDTAAAIAAMVKYGFTASESATALKVSLGRLIKPTKDGEDYMKRLGLSLYDANGQLKNGSKFMEEFADKVMALPDNQRLPVVNELFQNRQASKIYDYLNDIKQGRAELAAFTEGKIKDTQITSDWAKAQVAAGNTDAVARYDKGLETIKGSSSFKLKALQAQFRVLFSQLGSLILPPLLKAGEALVQFLEKVLALPAPIKIMIGAVAGIAAALGPVIFVFAQGKLALAEFLATATKILPTLKTLSVADVANKFAQNPNRTDIGQIGDKFVELRSKRGLKKVDQLISKDDITQLREASIAAGLTGESLDNVGDQALQAAVKIDAMKLSTDGLIAKENELIGLQKAHKLAASIDYLDPSAQKESYIRKITKGTNAAAVEADLAAVKAIQNKNAVESASIFNTRYRRAIDKLNPASYLGNIKNKFSGMFSNLFAGSERDMDIQKGMGAVLSQITQKYRDMRGEGGGLLASFTSIKQMSSVTFGQMAKDISIAKNEASGLKGTLSAAFGTGGKLKAAKSEATGLKATLKGLFSMGATGGVGMAGSFAKIALAMASVGWIAAIVVGALGGIILLIKGIKDNMSMLRNNFIGVWWKISAAVNVVKEALGSLADVFMDVFNQGGEKNGDATMNFWQKFSDVVTKVGDVIRIVLIGIAAGLMTLKPLIQSFAFMVKDVFNFIIAILTGDWRNAILAFVGFFYEGIRPILIGFNFLAHAVSVLMKQIVDIVFEGAIDVVSGLQALGNGLVEVANWLNPFQDIPKFTGLTDGIKGAKKATDGWFDSFGKWDLVSEMDRVLRSVGNGMGKVGNKIDEHKNDAENAGQDIGEAITDGVGSAMMDGAGKVGDWLKDWLSAVKSQLDSQLQEISKSAQDAFQKAHDSQMQVYDDQLAAIDALNKADEDRFAQEEYLARKREILADRELMNKNYDRNRALAIYEGRIDDARMLDLEHEKNSNDSVKSMADLENDRSKELVKAAREAQKQKIEDEKKAAEEAFKIQKESFDKQLEELLKYAPRTVGEYNSMLQKVNALLQEYGVEGWPAMAKTGGERFLDAIKEANESIIQDFAWSGDAAVTAWLRGFATADVVAILKSKLKGAADSLGAGSLGDGGVGGGYGSGGGGIDIPEVKPPEQPKIEQDKGVADTAIPGYYGQYQDENGKYHWSMPNSGLSEGESASGYEGDVPVDKKKEESPIPKENGDSWWSHFKDTGKKAYDFILDHARNIFTLAFDNADDGFFRLKNTGYQTFNWLLGHFKNIFTLAFDNADDGFFRLKDTGYQTFNWLLDHMRNIFTLAFDNADDGFYRLKDTGYQTWNWLLGHMKNILTLAFDNADDGWFRMKDTGYQTFNWLLGHMKNIFTLAFNNGDDGWSRFKNTGYTTWNWLLGHMRNILSLAFNNADSGWYRIRDTGYQVWNWLLGHMRNIFSIAFGDGTWRWYQFQNAGYNVWNFLCDHMRNCFRIAFNYGVDVWNNTLGRASIGGNAAGNQVAHFAAKGALTNGLTIAGEEFGHPEFIIPTNPAYRSRALKLLRDAASSFGVGLAGVNEGKVSGASTVSIGAGAGSALGAAANQTTIINVETVIADEAWFKQMAAAHDMKVNVTKARATGSQQRVISSAGDNNRGRYK